MDPAVAALVPMLKSRGFCARWRWPWSRTLTFIDERSNSVEISRVGADWRLRRFRRERGTNVIAVENESWAFPGITLTDALKRVLPITPWRVRFPDVAKATNNTRSTPS